VARRERVPHFVTMKIGSRVTLATTCLLFLSANVAWSQLPGIPAEDTSAATSQGQEPQTPPGVLDVTPRRIQLTDSAAAAMAAIERLGSTAELESDVRNAVRRQSELEALLAAMRAADYVRPERASRLRDQVALEQQRLEALRTHASNRMEELGRLRARWVERQSFWKGWRESLQGDPDLPAVQADLDRATATVDSVLERVSGTLTGLLDTQRSIEQLRIANEQQLGTLTAMRNRGRAALLERDQPLLFSAEHRAQLAEGGLRAWSPTATLRLGAYVGFARDHTRVLLMHVLLAIVLALIARRLRFAARTVGSWSGLLGHPWALGTFVSIVIALQRVLLAPPLWDVLLWAVFSATAVILVRKLFAAYALRLTVYLFAVFYPVFLLFEAMQLPAPVFRTALAVFAALALPAFVVMARRRTAKAAAENVNDPRRIWPLRIGAIMWAVVLGAVVLGFDSLGRWVLHVAVTSGAVVFVVLVLLAIIHGAIASLVVGDPGIRRHLALRVAVRFAQRLIFLIQIFTFIAAALVLLDVWQLTGSPVATWNSLLDTGFDVGPVNITIGRILLGVLVVYIAVLASWLVRNIVQSEIGGRWDFDRGVGDSISKLLHYLLITAGLFAALAVLGVELRNFAIVAGALGIGIGFGLQNVVSNFVSGLILLFERPVRVGDTVVVGGEWGHHHQDRVTLDHHDDVRPVRDDRAQCGPRFRESRQLDPHQSVRTCHHGGWRCLRRRHRDRTPNHEGVRCGARVGTSRSGARGAVHRLRRQLARLRAARLGPRDSQAAGGAQRSTHRDRAALPGGGHRDPVPAARPARPVRR
jgi:small-conductance mechanosensitive channel